jgi:hypothetical protein
VTVHAETLCLDDELQLFYKCKNSICTYKKSVPQLETPEFDVCVEDVVNLRMVYVVVNGNAEHIFTSGTL